jgi:hypothetical protein
MLPNDPDHYEAYYADKLWNLVPEVYRFEDGDAGPLNALVYRLGREAAILRRSIDRLWENQSIETSEDWLIPYLGDLLATNLVASLDARGRRLDVAKTIYYRRRKGTVGILEEIASDISGWDARVSEFFRRMSRTRHSLDPEIGRPADTDEPQANRLLEYAEGIVGRLTATDIGGLADVRNVYGATKAHTALDEFFHTADVRRGRGAVGWYDIPRLGVFVWRLRSFGVPLATPVSVSGCARHYTFDPTGRLIPLFAKSERSFGDEWVPPEEWQLPTPIDSQLLRLHIAELYPDSMEVFHRAGSFWDGVSAPLVSIWPKLGRFRVDASVAGAIAAAYHYGFASTVGAGPYDRRIVGEPAGNPPAPVAAPVTGGGTSLGPALAGLAPSGTARIGDSLTYTTVSDVGSVGTPIQHVRVEAFNRQRPLIRPAPGTTWTFTHGAGSDLELTGLFVSGGCELVLLGDADTVTIRMSTLDPGEGTPTASPVYAKAVDTRDLAPSRLWIEGRIRVLRLERCITAAIRTRGGASADVEQLELSDSIVQSVRTDGFGTLGTAAIKDPTRLAVRLRDKNDPVSNFLNGQLGASTQAALAAYNESAPPTAALRNAIRTALNGVISGPRIDDPTRFADVPLSAEILAFAATAATAAELRKLNRLLLEEAFPTELGDLALALASGTVTLERTTVLGPAYVHRLYASECVLDDRIIVEDTQHGCVRFSAWATGSVLPRKYESVEVAPAAPLFTTRVFGQPGYCQLLSSADRQIVSGGDRPSIREGGPGGSEMGVFASELDSIKHRSIGIKYEEFMPLGLSSVVIDVT